MKKLFNKNFLYYAFLTFVILIDSLILLFIGNDKLMFTIYLLINIVFITMISLKNTPESCAIISIMFIFFYSFFIENYIHYFNKFVIFEAEYIFLVPLLIGCLKVKNKKKINIVFYSFIYIIFNLVILLVNGKVDLNNYLLIMVVFITFLCFYYIFSECNITRKIIDLYKFMFILCAILTPIQTYLKFNVDTRNGIFSVFGLGIYTYFIMIYFFYSLKKYITKEKKISSMIFPTAICSILYIFTESKAALIVMFISAVIVIMISRGVSLRKLFIIGLSIALIPLVFKLLIYFNPKFSYMTNFNKIINYYFGNNNAARYEYGRFEAISRVFNSLPFDKKIFGIGFGSSTPLHSVFFSELGRSLNYPYYIRQYGIQYGFHHTSISFLLLDGGIILFVIMIVVFIKKFLNSIKKVRKEPQNEIGYIQLGLMVYLMYSFIYVNIFKEFKAMAIFGIIFGANYIVDLSKKIYV